MQSLIRSKSAGVTGGRGTAGPVLVGTFFMVAEAYLLPLPTADPGTWAPMSPAQVRPGCVLWTRWRPRRRLEP